MEYGASYRSSRESGDTWKKEITESAQSEQLLASKYYAKKAEQLTLFIKESRKKYGVRNHLEK